MSPEERTKAALWHERRALKWKGGSEEEFCRHIRQRWGDAYADDLEKRVSEVLS